MSRVISPVTTAGGASALQPPVSALPHRTSLPALTSLRFVAAAMIVVGHASERFGSWGLTGIPLNQGVSFFFVLSGFILYYNYPGFQRPDQVSRFIVARFARIWPAHAVCMILFFCVLPRPLWYIPYPRPTLFTLLTLNIALVQAWVPLKEIVLSLNGVAWSISVEMFFYLAFPILVFYRRFWVWHLAASVLIAVLMGVFIVQNAIPVSTDPQGLTALGLIYTNPLVRIIEFQVGILTGALFVRYRARRLSVQTAALVELAAIGVTLLALYAIPVVATSAPLQDGYGAVFGFWLLNEGAFPAFAILIFVLARHEGPLSRLLSRPLPVFLGEVSFAIYLVHQIILRGWTVNFPILAARPVAVQAAVFWCILIAAAVAIHLLIERPARRIVLRAWPRRSLG